VEIMHRKKYAQVSACNEVERKQIQKVFHFLIEQNFPFSFSFGKQQRNSAFYGGGKVSKIALIAYDKQ
jgi:hypothetical protein